MSYSILQLNQTKKLSITAKILVQGQGEVIVDNSEPRQTGSQQNIIIYVHISDTIIPPSILTRKAKSMLRYAETQTGPMKQGYSEHWGGDGQ